MNVGPATVAIVAGGSTVVRKLAVDHAVTAKPILAGFLLGSALYLVDAIDHSVATAFGALILVTALLVNGGAVYAIVGKAVA